MTITVVPGFTLTWEFNFDPTTAGGVAAPQYAFGVRTDDDSWWFHDGIAPTAWIRIGTGTSAAAGVIVEDEGVSLGSFATLDFVGAGVAAANAGGGVASITIPGGISGVDLQEEGAPIAGNPHSTLNFVGAGVTATDIGGVGTITVPGGIAGITVDEEGSGLGSFTALNFIGAGVTAANAGGGVASVTVPGGITLQDEGGAVTGNPHSTLNFVGAGVTATDVGGVGTITVPGGITGITVDEEGGALGSFTALNFIGAGVTAANAGGGVASVTVPGSTASPFYFGTGSDGSPTMDGSTTVNGMVPVANVYTGLRSYFWTNLTINSGITFKPDGYPNFVSGNLSGSGLSDTSGGDGLQVNPFQGPTPFNLNRPLPNGATGGIAGLATAGPSTTAIRYAAAGFAAGGATGANNGSAGGILQGGGGGGGNFTGTGGPGGVVTLSVPTVGDWEVQEAATTGFYSGTASGSARAAFTCGSAGGGGGINGDSTSVGGGGSGGYQVWYVNAFTGTVTIRSNGGAGANGVQAGGGSKGGGAGGGAGGIVVIVAGQGTTAPTPQVAGGTGGTASIGTGAAGNGGAGGSGKFIIFQ